MTPDEASIDRAALAARYREVTAAIETAARDAGREPDELTTIVVTKFHPAALVAALAGLGQRAMGESRQQEFVPKAEALRDLGLDWHFIGQLQSNKAARVVEHAATIHSLDRESLLTALVATQQSVSAFIQVNLTDDPARGGVPPAALPAFVERVLEAPTIRLQGLMGVAALDGDPRASFARLRELRDEVVTPRARAATGLSMGMSGDFAAAIAEGATHLRIGTAITGKRPAGAYART